MSSTGLVPSLTVAVRDVGVVANGSSPTPLLREGLLYLSSSLHKAENKENLILRDDIGIKTIIDTDPGEKTLFRYDLKHEALFTIEEMITVKILGLTSSRVCLRSGKFMENLRRELPLLSRWLLTWDLATTSDPSQWTQIERFRKLILRRDRIDESLAVLEVGSETIGRICKDLLSDAQAFPVIINGDAQRFDHTLVWFVLMLVLDIPMDVIEHTDSYVMQDVLRGSLSRSEAVQTKVSQATTDERWASNLKQRLEAKYGGIDRFFSTAGITNETREDLRKILLVDQKVSKKMLVDVSELEQE